MVTQHHPTSTKVPIAVACCRNQRQVIERHVATAARSLYAAVAADAAAVDNNYCSRCPHGTVGLAEVVLVVGDVIARTPDGQAVEVDDVGAETIYAAEIIWRCQSCGARMAHRMEADGHVRPKLWREATGGAG